MSETTLVLTVSAGKRIRDILTSQPSGTMFRIAVEGGGCSGFKYIFDLTHEMNENDILIESQGTKILVDKLSLDYLSGSEIDFVDDLMGASFKVLNPQATASCGCGTSFSI